MNRLATLIIAILTFFTAAAQVEHSIILDQSSFRKVNTDALTGVNVDPIRKDSSRNACARVKIQFANMSRAEVDALVLQFRSNTDIARQEIGYYDNILILEITAKPNTRFYVQSPEYGQSNEVTLNLEGDTEYEMEARLNQSFSIIVDTNVAGADIYIDGIKKAKTDANKRATVKEVMVGEHILKVVYKGVASEQKIVVNGDNISFSHNVDVAASEPQFVVFSVEPQSAVVTIDNKHYTLTEGAMRVVLPAGTYNYSVTATGYHSQSGTFAVAGDKVTKQIALTADAATVTLTAPDGAEIWVNEEYKGKGSWSGVLSSGTYIFEARKQGHKSGVMSKQITSDRPTQSYALPAPQPIYGSLMVDGTPLMADVALDGKPIGQTPLKKGGILIGNHTLTISKSGYDAKTQSVTITEGQTAVVDVALTKQATSELKGVTPIKIDTSLSAEQLYKKGNEYSHTDEYNSAVQYYYESAKRGYADAQNNLGWCYDEGHGVAKDAYEAIKWYRKAADQGNAAAQCNLGCCYDKGLGVTKDITEAVKWYRKAAEQGNAGAQFNLGSCYSYGRGVTKDITEAVKWYRKAAEQGDEDAKKRLTELETQNTTSLKGVTPIKIDTSLTAEQLNSKGWEYYNKNEYNAAVQYFYEAAKRGHAISQRILGYCYHYGLGLAKDYNQAVMWYGKSADQGDSWAQNNLGVCYRNGLGVAQNYNEAVKWYRKAAEQGNATAQNNLAISYLKGQGVAQNYNEAVKWYRKAAEQGNTDAQCNLGVCYKNGFGTAKNMDEAVKWLRKAAEKGHEDATMILSELGY